MNNTRPILFLVFVLFSFLACQQSNEVDEQQPTSQAAGSEDEADIAIQLQIFNYSDWLPELDPDSGCSCTFRLRKDDYSSDIFATDYGSNGNIKVNGQMILLTGNQYDHGMELYKYATSGEPWLEISQEQATVFGNTIDFSREDWYGETKTMLMQALAQFDEVPTEIPITFGPNLGMGMRGEFRSMCSEALAEWKTTELEALPVEFTFNNAEFAIKITAFETGRDDGGGPQFEGTLRFTTSGPTLLQEIPVWGACGC